jgi:alkanesulfonate monooxygenase SsuD/methylene tetrahydromethanopterin reductase-like flavin-dependent oxidoreductase (luciferase family)
MTELEFSFYHQVNNRTTGEGITERGFDFYLKSTLEAEKLDYAVHFVPDHLILPENTTVYDSWTLISGLAAKSRKIRLASMVTPIPLYQPQTLAKRIVTADHISGGRIIFGAGAGWNQTEFDAYGIQFLSFKKRYAQMREGLDIITGLCTSDEAFSYEGKYYTLRKAVFQPKPIQKPYPPIWFGGSSTQTLKAVAEYGSGWIPYEIHPNQLTPKIETLQKLLKTYGRELQEITLALSSRTVLAPTEDEVKKIMDMFNYTREFVSPNTKVPHRILVGTPKQLAEDLKRYMEIGITHFCLGFQPPTKTIDGLRLCAEEVIPRL